MRDGLLQVQVLRGNSVTDQVTIETSDGTTVKTVTLPPNTFGGQAVGPGSAVYSVNSPFTLVKGDGTTKTTTAPSSGYDLESDEALGPYPARYLPLQDAASSHPLLYDTVTGTTLDLSAVAGSTFISAIFNSADGRTVLIQDAPGATAIQPAKPKAVHHFTSDAFIGGFTADGQAIVAEPTGTSHDRLVAFNPDTGKETQIASGLATKGAGIPLAVGNKAVFGSGSDIDIFGIGDGKDQKLSTGGAEIARMRPVADGRHALIFAGEDPDTTVFLLDTGSGTLTKLPALSGTNAKLSTELQRYQVFGPGSNVAPSGHAFAVDTFTGQVKTLNLPQTFGASSSSDGRVRSFQLGTPSTVIVDLTTGAMNTVPGEAQVSPAGDQLLVHNGKKPLEVTDLKGHHIATLQPGFGIWTPA